MTPYIPSYLRIDPSHLDELRNHAYQVQLDIERGEVWMRHAQTIRAKLLRRRNHMKATTKDLPIEILSLIFRHATNTSDAALAFQCQTTFRISHVCSYWREVAWSTPEMWTNFQSRVVQEGDIPALLERLHLYLKNVGNLHLSLKIDFRSTRGSSGLTDLDQWLCVHENAQKIRSLALNDLPIDCFETASPFPNLEDLAICNFNLDRTIDLSVLPKLKNLTLENSFWTPRLPSSQITTLRLIDIDPRMCANMLKQCPHLREFANIYLSELPRGFDAGPNLDYWDTDLTFDYLENFSWSYVRHVTSHMVLFRIRLPVAKTIRWMHCRDVDVVHLEQTVVAFFSNLAKSVTTLAFERLSMAAFPASLVKFIFGKHPQIEEVICQECTVSSTVDFFSILVPWRIPTNHNDGNIYLPSLETLTLAKGWHFDEEFRGPVVRSLVRAQVQRYVFGIINPQRFWRPNSRFRYNFNGITQVDLEHSEEHCRTMREMRRNGLMLEILVDGEELVW